MGLWSTRVLPFLLFLLLRQRERWRSIVMNTSVCVCVCVCLSVCLSASLSPESHARSLPIFVHVAYGRGSVLLRQGNEISRGRGNLGVFFPTYNALYSMTFGTHTKTAEPIEMPFCWRLGWAQGTMHVLDGGADSPKRWVSFRGLSGPFKTTQIMAYRHGVRRCHRQWQSYVIILCHRVNRNYANSSARHAW